MIHLRTAKLPRVGIPSNPVEVRACRGGFSGAETVCHILQVCPVGHDERVFRHDAVVKKVAAHCTRPGWRAEEEPRVWHEDGTLYKSDQIIFKRPTQAVVVDAQVSREKGPSMLEIWKKKVALYCNSKFLVAARKKRPDTEFSFHPVILGARGIWSTCNSSTNKC